VAHSWTVLPATAVSNLWCKPPNREPPPAANSTTPTGGFLLVGAGLIWLWRLGGIERNMAWLAGIPVILGWLTSLGTIGDHRFRIPQMGLSLFLQVVGVYGLKRRFKLPA